MVNDFSDDEEDEEEEEEGGADLASEEMMRELTTFFGVHAQKVKHVLSLWNSHADLYNSLCEKWTSDTDTYREDRTYRTMKAAIDFLDVLNDVSTRRHKSWYAHLFITIVPRQMRRWGDLWRFSTRSVEGRGGRLKHIGRRMLCWRRRSATYHRTVKAKDGGSQIINQSYNSTPERQLMRAACSPEDRGHTQKRSKLATT